MTMQTEPVVALTFRNEKKLAPYMNALRSVGIEPVLVTPERPFDSGTMTGLVLTGGTDLDPAHYNQEKDPRAADPDVERDALRTFIRSPPEGRIDDDLATDPGSFDAVADFGDDTRAVGAEDDRDLDARVLSLADPDVAMVERSRSNVHDCFAWSRVEVGTLFNLEVARISGCSENAGSHSGLL